ncbi:MAG: hypothetical protein U1E76_06625 [Planctomycetota bacterium]
MKSAVLPLVLGAALACAVARVPDWVENPPRESGYRYASGRSTSASRVDAREAAIHSAVRDLALQKGVYVEATIEVVETSTGVNAVIHSKQGTSHTISGIEIVKTQQVPRAESSLFEYCVLLRISEQELFR